MIYQHKHRIIDEIEKQKQKGQIIHFLVGDGVNDNFFYDVYHGVLSMGDTLKEYYLKDAGLLYDYFIHIINSANNITCYTLKDKNVKKIKFEDMFPDPTVDSPLDTESSSSAGDGGKRGHDIAQAAGSDLNNRIAQLNDMLSEGKRRILIFLENFEWIANLYGDTSETTWIATMKRWEKSRNLQVIVSIKDFDLLKKFNFSQKEIFVGYPGPTEIKFSYFRHLLRNRKSYYRFDMKTLDDIAHRMSAGNKSLCSSMRILREVLRQGYDELSMADFESGFDMPIEEKVSWEDVRLERKIKDAIKSATETFLQGDANNPPRKGLIFTGPPGTGKTLIAKALANEAKCHFESPTLADLKGEYIGESSAKVRRLFAKIRSAGPTILFIDEADTVFPSRSLGAGDRDSFGLDMVNQFLQELDGAQSGHQKIFTIAATNRFEAIDPAIKSRLSSEPIHIPLPSKEMRRLIFDDNLSKGGQVFSLEGKIFKEEVLNRSENMSGRDIMNFVKKLREEVSELKNDEATARKFRELFKKKESAFLEELATLGIFSRSNLVHPNNNSLRLKDIIGYEDLKGMIRLQVDYIRASMSQKKQYDTFGIEPRKGVLLYGPPGNGKSVLAKAIAGEYGFYFFKVLSRDFANSYPDEQIKKLERIFTEVVRFSKMMADAKGIVLFFDEFDSLAGVNVINPVVRGSLLNYIASENGLRSKDSRILFMAATNFPEYIDDAIKRQGRIDVHLYMDNPGTEEGKTMLREFFARDKAPIVQPDSKLIEQAYLGLKEEKGQEQVREYIKTNWEKYSAFSKNEREEHLKAIMEQSRPSGAELETLYKELKEIAFATLPPDESKLTITEQTLQQRFRSDSK